jgi:aspartate 4-decarboxylase
MIYLFSSLKKNFLLREGDAIAIVTPIFSPYLEIPKLQEFQLKEIFIETTEKNQWQIPEKEIEKLKDPKIKAIFLVDPTNPTAIALEGKALDRLVALVRGERKDLIVLTDTVYAPFVDHFRSLVDEIPENTICIYSYSKYFGVTGWRLGVIMLHEKNIFDRLIADHPEDVKKKLQQRYQTITMDVSRFPFIERVVADSRQEALAHTGGLSTPQQCLMAFLSLFDLMDEKSAYKKEVQKILKKRMNILYKSLSLPPPSEEGNTFYYAMLDLLSISREKYGELFAEHLKSKQVIGFFFDLAEKKATICLPGFGFGGPLWSLRISLANCDDEDYAKVGKNIKDLLESAYLDWKAISS